MIYHFKIHKEKNGYWAECMELSGCMTQGKTLIEIYKNMREALNLYLDEPESSKIVFPAPNPFLAGADVVDVPVSPRVAFAYRVRALRIGHDLTQTAMCRKLGLSGLASYQNLERSKTANPRFETLMRIKEEFPEFDLNELVAAKFSNSAKSAIKKRV